MKKQKRKKNPWKVEEAKEIQKWNPKEIKKIQERDIKERIIHENSWKKGDRAKNKILNK